MKIACRGSMLCLALVLLASLTASAAGEDGITTAKDGRQTIAIKPVSPFVPLQSDFAAGLVRIYDNSSRYPLGVYWCCNGWTVSGSGSPTNTTYAEATPFTPSSNATVEKIAVAVGYVSGTNEVTISLNVDNGSLPGSSLASANVSNLPPFASCCQFEVANFATGVPVTAGTQYWVVVQTTTPTSDTSAAWNDNDTNQTLQPFAYYSNGLWQSAEGILGAFAVVGTVP